MSLSGHYRLAEMPRGDADEATLACELLIFNGIKHRPHHMENRVFLNSAPKTAVSGDDALLQWRRWTPRAIPALVGRHRWTLILLSSVFISLILSTATALTRRPWCDEAWFASPAYNLLHHHFMGMTILDPHGFVFAPLLKGIDQFTYLVMPCYLVLQSLWYSVLGFSLVSMRAISIVWSAAALVAWFIVVQWLTKNRNIALIAVLLLGTEEYFVLAAATGRMDMMCAALNLISLALYVRLRENVPRALSAASIAAALSLFTHPNGLFSIVSLGIFVLVFDRRRITWRSIGLAALPFVVLACLWGVYILKAPDLFIAQMRGQANIPNRLELTANVFKAVKNEFLLRYQHAYELTSPFPLSMFRIVFFSYVGAILMTLCVPQLRRQQGVRLLLLLMTVHFAFLSCFQKNWYYLVHIIPFYTALLAVVIHWMWQRPRLPKWSICMYVLVLVGLNVGIVTGRAYYDSYRSRYLPAIDYLRRNSSPTDLIVGSGELGFDLGFDGRVVDDARLGYLSGRVPEFIVMDSQYSLFWSAVFLKYEPNTLAYMNDLLRSKYSLVYDQSNVPSPAFGFYNHPYKIYKRKPPIR